MISALKLYQKGGLTMEKKCRISGLAILIAVIVGWSMVFASSTFAASNELVIYYPGNEKVHKAVTTGFNKRYPDIKVKTVSLSNWPMVQRVVAERNNPGGDCTYSAHTMSLEYLKKAGVLAPYTPKNSAVPAEFVDPGGFYVYHWVTTQVFAVNTKVLKEKGIPIPRNWEALVKPEYKGLIAIAAPTKSGTGLSVFTMLYDAFGWNYIDNLHQNMFQYNSSGGAAGRQAGAGEIAIGLTYDTVVMSQIQAGLPVELVFPPLTPNTLGGGALFLDGPNPKNAKLFLDWMASKEGAKAYGPLRSATTIPGFGKLDISKAPLWKLRRPIDPEEFKREWAKRYEK
jgi:iron(III) transport system substrate-binding protein